jgi:D-galactarolactone isomerase
MEIPTLKPPAHACDTHMHIYEDRFAIAPTAAFKPPHAPVSEYRKVQSTLGLHRVVVVQPSSYAFDNTCTMEAVAAFGSDARAVVVVGPEVSDAELKRLTAAGARGLRYFMLPGGVLTWQQLVPMAKRVAAYGWHIQLQLDGRLLPEHDETLMSLPCDLVIDHNGKFLEPVAVTHPAFQCLLRLLDSGRCWVKLSAPYETSKSGPPRYDDVSVLARALVAHNRERCVWATNWPHPNRNPAPSTNWPHPNRNPAPSNAEMLDLLLDWAPDEPTRHHILVDNPARLYGF